VKKKNSSWHVHVCRISRHIAATVALHTIIAFDTIGAFVIHFVALLMFLLLMWHKEHL
jgi:hypothetical protein